MATCGKRSGGWRVEVRGGPDYLNNISESLYGRAATGQAALLEGRDSTWNPRSISSAAGNDIKTVASMYFAGTELPLVVSASSVIDYDLQHRVVEVEALITFVRSNREYESVLVFF